MLAMERMYQHLGLLEWVDSNMLIDKASVPVIKLVINLHKLDKLRNEDERVFALNSDESMPQQLKIDLIFNDIMRARQITDPYTGETYLEDGGSDST